MTTTGYPGLPPSSRECPACLGAGVLWTSTHYARSVCDLCHGTGRVPLDPDGQGRYGKRHA